jgi:hypothetical protein
MEVEYPQTLSSDQKRVTELPLRKSLIGSGFCKWVFEKLVLLFEEDYFPLDIALKVVDTYINLMYESYVAPFQLILLGDEGVY